jgi:hypothetical protein
MSAESAWASSISSPGDLRAAVEAELKLEDAELLFPLLGKLTSAAEQIAEGNRVDAAYLGEGIRLWERYTAEVHSGRVRILSRVYVPGAAPTGVKPEEPARRGFGRSRKAKPATTGTVETPQEMLVQIQADQSRMAERRGAFESLLRDYESNQYWSREMLAALLRSSAFSERAWAEYEEDFARRHFEEQLGPEDQRKVLEELEATREHREQLEGDMRRCGWNPPRRAPPRSRRASGARRRR